LGLTTRLYASITSVTQFIHAYRTSGVFYYYPTVFWYPSDDRVKPAVALQVTAGLEREWGDGAYAANVESYYRITRDHHGFNLAAASSSGQDLMGSVLYGSERAFGASVSLRKRSGSFTGAARYTIGWLYDTFAELNAGEAFAPLFDRRHELELWATYSPAEDWSLSVIGVLTSTPPETSPGMANAPSSTYDRGSVQAALGYLDINGSKTPGFQRLEFSIMKKFVFWDAPCQVTLRLMNAYGLLDPFAWQLFPSSNSRRQWSISQKDLGVFPLYPAISMSVRF
jgi:hypothetical protein